MSTHSLSTSQAEILRKRKELLKDPAKFYGKGGNWISRLIDRLLLAIS